VTPASRPAVIKNNHDDGVASIETAPNRLADADRTGGVAAAVPHRSEDSARFGTLFGANPGSVRVRDGVDLIAPALEDLPEAEAGQEINPHCITTD